MSVPADHAPSEPPRHRSCPVIVGPTAVGKTALITALAKRLPVEIISLDSRQIYRGLRLGTAQPSPAEQALCRHHLIDFLPPEERYTAILYRKDFERAFREISDRGVQPVLVGGAGMYLTALRDGFVELPAGSEARLPGVRTELDSLPDEEIRARLQDVDAASYERIHANDRYRSQRALEILLLAGVAMSELMAAQGSRPSLDLRFPTVRLDRPVEELDRRIAQRTEAILKAGWIAETEALLARHDADSPGLVSIGYREIVGFLRGVISREELAAWIVRATRQYAKRQRTWFRQVEVAAAGHPDDDRLIEAVVAMIDALPQD